VQLGVARRLRDRRYHPVEQGTTPRNMVTESSVSSLPPRAAPPTLRRASRGCSRSTSTLDAPTSLHSLLRTDQCSGSHSPAVSPTSPLSPIWDALDLLPLDVPELQDEKIQQFFHQIVEYLNVIQQRTPSASGGIPNMCALVTGQELRMGVYENTTCPPSPLVIHKRDLFTPSNSKGRERLLRTKYC